METPWPQLKQTEMQALRQRRAGGVRRGTLLRLRELIASCRRDPDAEASICYHGSLALVFEAEGNRAKALKHRKAETRKIQLLHRLEKQNPSGGYATQNYQENDLRQRLEILAQMRANALTGPAPAPNRRGARRRLRQAARDGGR